MPFTPAHPVAVLLLRRTPLDFAALAIGSMAPDIPYFVEFSANNQYGHTLLGSVVQSLPQGLAAWLLFRFVMAEPLLALLPTSHRERLASAFRPPRLTIPAFLLVLLSLYVGILTHIVWDSFTHQHGYMVERLPVLSLPVFPGSPMKVYKALQFGCGILGLVLLGVVYIRWHHQATPSPYTLPANWKPIFAPILIGLMLVGAVTSALILAISQGNQFAAQHFGSFREHFAFYCVVGSISGFVAELVLFSLVYRLIFRPVVS
jgi:hypothetical protein